MLNFVICDDSKNILDKFSIILENIFIKHNYEAKVGFTTSNVTELLKYVDENKVDVLILDINLKSNKTGKNKNTYFIFTTAHLEYAMLAYKFKTFDYLAKPVTYERLEDTIVRLFEDINGVPKKYIKIDNKNSVIDESDILYIKRDGMKLIYHTRNKDYETYSSFNKIQDKIPENFVRSHKSYIVNIDNISNIDSVSNLIYFDEGISCAIGPRYKKNFMEVINKSGIIE